MVQKQYKIISFYIVIMENNNSAIFYKTDDNRIINENCIRWVKKNERLFRSLHQNIRL